MAIGKGGIVKRFPKVTALIPVRNGQEFIAACLASLYGQSYQDFEVLVVDNQSSDATRAICAELLDSRSRLVVNHGPPTIADALNLGITLANGEYIARLDSDDIARSDRFQKQVDFLENNPSFGIVGSWMGTIGDRRGVWKYPVSDDEVKISLLYRSAFGHPSVMFRSEWNAGQKGFYDSAFDLAEDWEMWTRISSVTRGANLPEPLTVYRMHDSQETKLNQMGREQCVSIIVSNYCTRLGLPKPPSTMSVGKFFGWWSAIYTTSLETGLFSRKIVRKSAYRHAIILIRRYLRAIAERTGILQTFLYGRNFVERKVRK